MEIIHLLHNGAQKDKINQSSLSTSLELCKDQLCLDASSESALPGYHTIAKWESPRIILTHCFEGFLPPQVWQKQPKVMHVFLWFLFFVFVCLFVCLKEVTKWLSSAFWVRWKICFSFSSSSFQIRWTRCFLCSFRWKRSVVPVGCAHFLRQL